MDTAGQPTNEIQQAEQMAGLDEKTAVAGRRAWYRLGLRSREPYERLAYRNLLFWGGNQNLEIAEDLRTNVSRARILMPPGCEATVITDNLIPERVRQIITQLMEIRPDIVFEALSPDPRHIAIKTLADRANKWRDDIDEEEEKSEEELLWAIGTPEVYRGTLYSADSKDLVTKVHNFWHVVKDPHSTEWPPRWVIVFDAWHVDEIERRFGQKVEPESVGDELQYLDRLAMNVALGKPSVREPLRQHAIVREAMVPPCAKWPKGHVWVDCGEKQLSEHDLQGTEDGIWPLQRAGWFPTPGRMYDISLVELLIAGQKQHNNLVSQINEGMYRDLRKDIVISGGAAATAKVGQEVIDPVLGTKQWTIPPGIDKFQFVEYNPRIGEMIAQDDRVINRTSDAAGASKPTLGQPLNRAGRVAELLISKEADSAALAYHIRRYARQMSCPLAEQKIRLMGDYFKTFRELPGREGEEIALFLGQWLKEVGRVHAVPVPHMSPAMRLQAEAQAFETGLLGPYLSPEAELSARTALRRRGLTELEEEIAKTYGPYEDLCAYVGERDGLRKQAMMAQTAGVLQQMAAAGQGGMENGQGSMVNGEGAMVQAG